MKWQVVVIPNGLISSLIRPFEGKANDWKMLKVSQLQNRFRKLFAGHKTLYLYGDSAYNCSYSILGAYKHYRGRFLLLKEQFEANRRLSTVRIAVEHAFRHVAKY